MFNRLPETTIYKSPRHNTSLVTPGLLQQCRGVTIPAVVTAAASWILNPVTNAAMVTDPSCRRRDRVTNGNFASAKTTSLWQYTMENLVSILSPPDTGFTREDYEIIYAVFIDRYEHLDSVLRSMPTPQARDLAEEEKARVEAVIRKLGFVPTGRAL